MNNDAISQLDIDLTHAGEKTVFSEQMLKLEKLRITPEKQLPKMEFLFHLFGKPCFPRRELVAITGKAKSWIMGSVLLIIRSWRGLATDQGL